MNFNSNLVLLAFSTLLLDVRSAPHPAGATMVPATPRYDLRCPTYTSPSLFVPGDPKACDSLFQRGIPNLSRGNEPFLFTRNSSRALAPTKTIPFSIYSVTVGGPNGTMTHHLPEMPSNSNSTNEISVCNVTFRFASGAALDHEESWHTRLLVQNALIAWGNCIAYGPPGPSRYGVIRPKPHSEISKLVMEVQVLKGLPNRAIS